MHATVPPQADGQVKGLNSMLRAMLTAVVHLDQKDWDLHLPFLTAAYRAMVHPAKGFSPNFGQEVNLPVDVM